jgi:hypothetical protein
LATTQKQTFNQDNIVDAHLWLIDQIREETLDAIANYLKNMNVPFDCLPNFLKNPIIYPGKIVGLEQIIERFLNLTISKHYKEIQAEGLPVKFVINSVRESLFQGGWSINRNLNITVATRGGDDARKAVSTSRIDEPPRLLPVKNKGYKTKSKPKPKKRGPKVKTIKKVKISAKPNQCDYCGVYIKTRKIHVNICQNPKTHHFCSDECKINWIFAPLEKENIVGGIKKYGA